MLFIGCLLFAILFVLLGLVYALAILSGSINRYIELYEKGDTDEQRDINRQ